MGHGPFLQVLSIRSRCGHQVKRASPSAPRDPPGPSSEPTRGSRSSGPPVLRSAPERVPPVHHPLRADVVTRSVARPEALRFVARPDMLRSVACRSLRFVVRPRSPAPVVASLASRVQKQRGESPSSVRCPVTRLHSAARDTACFSATARFSALKHFSAAWCVAGRHRNLRGAARIGPKKGPPSARLGETLPSALVVEELNNLQFGLEPGSETNRSDSETRVLKLGF